MFKKLQRKFLWGSALVLLLVITLVSGVLFWAASRTVTRQTQALISMILESDGELPDRSDIESQQQSFLAINEGNVQEALFFSVRITDGEGKIISKRIHGLSDSDAVVLAQTVADGIRTQGQMADTEGHLFQYGKKSLEDGSILVVFVDSASRFGFAQLIIIYMAALWGIIFVLFVILMGHFSGKLVEPFIQNDEKQKRFITNASHELKTPLAVISANNEMTEAMGGKTKWTESTRRQIKRLQSLIEDLVVLTRMDEMKDEEMTDVDFSAVVREAAESFRSVAESGGKRFECSMADSVHVRGEKRALQQVTNILLDNAVKYCDDGGSISVRLTEKGRGGQLTVSNTYAEGKQVDTSRFFERFYRQDESHNSEKSGFGIGLSMAAEITARMKGKLKTGYAGDTISFTVEMP